MAAQCREVLGSHATICCGQRADRYGPTDNRGISSILISGFWLWLGSRMPRFIYARYCPEPSRALP
jgi:hypothetical protein